jgi:hypothetical protein
MFYPNNDTNNVNMNIINNIVHQLENKPNEINYNAAQVETEKLLNREITLFMINSVITLGLMITVFRIIS